MSKLQPSKDILPGTFPIICFEDLLRDAAAARAAIRAHRDEVGHDRCWLSDFPLWATLSDLATQLTMPNASEFLRRCERFHASRQSSTPFTPSPQTPPTNFDGDLAVMDEQALAREVTRLHDGIRAHYESFSGHHHVNGFGMYTGRWDSDHNLYQLLPEKLTANTCLPSRAEFRTGCIEFCNTHPSLEQLLQLRRG